MSFRSSDFGTGFSRSAVARTSIQRRFNDLILAHGEVVTIYKRTKTGESGYGEPTWSEDDRATKALVSRRLGHDATPAGDLPRQDVTVHFAAWEDIDDSGVFYLDIGGTKYHIKSVDVEEAYCKAVCDRRVDN